MAHKVPLREEQTARELDEIADELERLADYVRNVSNLGSDREITGMRNSGDITQIKIRLGQIRYRLHLS